MGLLRPAVVCVQAPFPCCLASYTPLVSPVATSLTYWLLVSNLVAGAYRAKQAGKHAGRTQPGHTSLQGKSRQDENVLTCWTVFHTQPTLRVTAGRSVQRISGRSLPSDVQGFQTLPRQLPEVLFLSSVPVSRGRAMHILRVAFKDSLERLFRTAVCPAVGHVLPCFSCLCPSPQPLTHKHCLVGLPAASTQEVQAQSAGLRRV